MMRLGVLLALAGLVAGCAEQPEVTATPAQVAQAAYRHPGPPTITLYTVVNNRSNSGAHSALMVSGSERVMFDPAGSWYHPYLPQVGDTHYGIKPEVEDFFIDYHARATYRVVRQQIEVSPDVAEHALALVRAHSAVAPALCSNAISGVLAATPGFEAVGRSYFPSAIMRGFATLPDVREDVFRDDDPDEKEYAVRRYVQG